MILLTVVYDSMCSHDSITGQASNAMPSTQTQQCMQREYPAQQQHRPSHTSRIRRSIRWCKGKRQYLLTLQVSGYCLCLCRAAYADARTRQTKPHPCLLRLFRIRSSARNGQPWPVLSSWMPQYRYYPGCRFALEADWGCDALGISCLPEEYTCPTGRTRCYN